MIALLVVGIFAICIVFKRREFHSLYTTIVDGNFALSTSGLKFKKKMFAYCRHNIEDFILIILTVAYSGCWMSIGFICYNQTTSVLIRVGHEIDAILTFCMS